MTESYPRDTSNSRSIEPHCDKTTNEALDSTKTLISLEYLLHASRKPIYPVNTGYAQVRLGECPGWSELVMDACAILFVLSKCSYVENKKWHSHLCWLFISNSWKVLM